MYRFVTPTVGVFEPCTVTPEDETEVWVKGGGCGTLVAAAPGNGCVPNNGINGLAANGYECGKPENVDVPGTKKDEFRKGAVVWVEETGAVEKNGVVAAGLRGVVIT